MKRDARIVKAILRINTLTPYLKDAALLAHHDYHNGWIRKELMKEARRLGKAIAELEAAVAEAEVTSEKEVA